LLFQFDCPALLAGCGPPDRVGKSLVSELAGSLTSSAHVLGGCGGILRADAVVTVMSSNAGKSRVVEDLQMPRGDNAATNPHHNNNSHMFEDTPRCKLHERLPAPQSQRISRVPPSLPPHARSYHSPKDSPHINRRLRATTTHDLSKPAQLRRPGTHPRRSSQRSTCSCRTRETSRSTSTGRVIGQSESPSCAVS
jgi:hypothetical protein